MADTQLELIKTSRTKKYNEDKDLAKKMRELDRAWEEFEDICKVMNLKPTLPDVGYAVSVRDKLGIDLLNALQKYVVFFDGKNYNGTIPKEVFSDLKVIDQHVLHIYQQKVYVEKFVESENKVRRLIDEVLLAEDLQAKEGQIKEYEDDNISSIYIIIAILFLTIFNAPLVHYLKWI